MQEIIKVSKEIDRLEINRKKIIEFTFMKQNDEIIKLKKELQSAKDENNSLKGEINNLNQKIKQLQH